ncbi:MAG: alpha/beta hydrolase [Janthinobacterium lividum]
MRRYHDASARARATLPHEADLVYDPASGQALDWFHGAPGGPVLLWIHGGYWRALSRADNACVAPGLVAAGIHVAVMDYSLAPAVTLDEIVRQVRAAAAWVHRHAAARGADPARLFIGGSSAGGHLCAMAAAPGGDAPPLRGILPLSGLFDLEPIRLSHINAWLALDEAAVRRLSPLHHLPARPTRMLAAYGGRETREFQRQTDDYAAAWRAAGHDALVLPQPTRHHFDIVLGLGDPADPLCAAAGRFLRER